MSSIQKIFNSIKIPNLKSVNLTINTHSSGLLHNTVLLYVIFIISFGNFLFELIAGDMYFIIIYLLIGFLTTFFNKNMIVVLLMASIFANILKYGVASVEGFDDSMDPDTDILNDDLDNAIPYEFKKIKNSQNDDIDDSDNKDSSNNSIKSMKSKKNKQKEAYTDRELDEMTYSESEKMLDNQKLLLQNMKDFKPFLDTINSITKTFSSKSS